jgi:hypothetical protein
MREYRKKKIVTPHVTPPVTPHVTPPVTPPVTPDLFLKHRIKFKHLNREFLDRSAFPVHKYNSRHLMVDIRDHYSPSLDKECCYPVI